LYRWKADMMTPMTCLNTKLSFASRFHKFVNVLTGTPFFWGRRDCLEPPPPPGHFNIAFIGKFVSNYRSRNKLRCNFVGWFCTIIRALQILPYAKFIYRLKYVKEKIHKFWGTVWDIMLCI
jgi:hypothetical protein